MYYNIGCSNHLYFIEKQEKKYLAKCLYCEKEQYFNNIGEMGNIAITGVFRDKIYEMHKIDCDFKMINKIVMDLVINNPSLTNYEVLLYLKEYLYSITLSDMYTEYFKHYFFKKNILSEMKRYKKIREVSDNLKETKEKIKSFENKKLVKK